MTTHSSRRQRLTASVEQNRLEATRAHDLTAGMIRERLAEIAALVAERETNPRITWAHQGDLQHAHALIKQAADFLAGRES